MALQIAVETPLQDDVRALIAEFNESCHPAAWAVYERAGFTRCGPVLDYPDSKWSIFYAKSLTAESAAA